MKKRIIQSLFRSYYFNKLISLSSIRIFKDTRICAIVSLVFASQLFFSATGYAQSLDSKITFELQNKTLQQGLNELKRCSGFRVAYTLPQVSAYTNITIKKGDRTVREILELLLSNTTLTFLVKDKSILVFEKTGKQTISLTNINGLQFVSGVILDSESTPLQGITVWVKGTHQATVSNEKGEYKLPANKDGVLIFSCVGVKRLEEPINNRSEIDVMMADESKMLKSIIVTGYGTKKSSEMTGSVVQLSGDQLLQGVPASTDIYNLLKGKVAGMLGSTKNGLPVYTVRGSTDISGVGPTSPLIVLDGSVMGNVDVNELINPQDIETISVLKDAASTSIYGSRAALGVIVITTKRGKPGLKVSLNNRTGVTTYPNRMRYMNTTEWIDHNNKYLSGVWDGVASYQTAYPNKSDFITASQIFSTEEAGQNYDWDKALHGNGYYNDLNLSFSSGSEKSRLYGSVGWYKEKGGDFGSELDRKTFKVNADFHITPKVTASFNTTAILSQSTSQNGQLDANNYLPWLQPKDVNGSWNKTLPYRSGGSPNSTDYADVPNVLYEAANFENTSIYKNETYQGMFILKYKPFESVTLQSSNTLRHNIANGNSYYDANSQSGRLGYYSTVFSLASWFPSLNANGILDLSNSNSNYLMTSNTASFRQQFGKHLVSAFIGQEFSKITGESNTISYYGVQSGERNAGAAANIGNFNTFAYGSAYLPIGSETESAMFSIFGETSYQYNQRYIATASVRTDASPSFGKDNRYGTFYSLSGAWQVNNEAFMKNIKKIVTDLKLRYAYGTSGRDLGGNYLNKTYYSNASSYSSTKAGSIISQLANNSIKWETTYNHSVGLNFGLINRINGTIDLYHKRSDGLVQPFTLPATKGAYTQQTNIGEVINKGLEISLQADVVKGKEFSWTVTGNISFNKNKITKLSTGVRTFYQQVGNSIGDIMAIPYQGVNPENGAPLFLLGDGTISEGLTSKAKADTLNMKKIGNTTPKYYGGFQSSWTYHRFTLSLDWYFAVGQLVNNISVYNEIDPSLAYGSGQNTLEIPTSWHIWTGKGDTNANMPNIYAANSWYFNSGINSAFFQDASYLRLQNVRLNYGFSKQLISKVGLSAASLYVNVDNVLVFKKQSNWKDIESTDSPLRIVLGVNIDF